MVQNFSKNQLGPITDIRAFIKQNEREGNRMTDRPLELCCKCEAATDKAGISDDSLYCPCGIGPFCEDCYSNHIVECNEQLQAKLDEIMNDRCPSWMGRESGGCNEAPDVAKIREDSDRFQKRVKELKDVLEKIQLHKWDFTNPENDKRTIHDLSEQAFPPAEAKPVCPEFVIRDLIGIQLEVSEWHSYNFPDADPYKPLLKILEELGELSGAHLKEEEGIRGSAEFHQAAAKDAIADILVALTAYCFKRGWSMNDIFNEVWPEVKKRDWIKDPMKGGTGKAKDK